MTYWPLLKRLKLCIANYNHQ